MKVAVVMGSASDLPVMDKALTVMKRFGLECVVRVLSAHRTPDDAAAFATAAEADGYCAIIAAAGKAAHLPGVLAAFTVLPVIGVPINSGSLGGMDALLAIVQMPPGVPVATVGIDAAENAALLAVQIAATSDARLRNKLHDYKQEIAQKTRVSDQQVAAEIANRRQ